MFQVYKTRRGAETYALEIERVFPHLTARAVPSGFGWSTQVIFGNRSAIALKRPPGFGRRNIVPVELRGEA